MALPCPYTVPPLSNGGGWKHQGTLNEIDSKLSEITEASVESIALIGRDANNLVDFLAEGGVNCGSPLVASF